MKEEKLTKVLFILLRVFGILIILEAFLETSIWTKHTVPSLGNMQIYFISPLRILLIIASISIYLSFVRLFARMFSVKNK